MHRSPAAVALAVFLAVGCDQRHAATMTGDSKPDAPPAATTTLATVAASASSAAPASTWADHAHDTAHGGRVRTAIGGGHLELKLTTSGVITVWLLDEKGQPRTAKGAMGTARITGRPSGVRLGYDATADALSGSVSALHPGVTMVVDVRVETSPGTAVSARFNVMPTED